MHCRIVSKDTFKLHLNIISSEVEPIHAVILFFSATCIELAKADIEDILEMTARETKEGRLTNFKETKTDIQNMTQSEMHDVKEWLKNCSSDLKILGKKVNSSYYRRLCM